MDLSRRAFLKAGTVGGSIALGLDVSEARAEMRESQDRPHHRDAKHLPLLRGLLRRDHPHARGQGEERHRLGRPRRGGSRTTPSTAAPSARRGATLKEDISNPGRLTTPRVRKPGLRQVGGDRLGRRDRPDRPAREGHARPLLRGEERQGAGRQPQPRHGDDRRLHRHERVQLPPVEGVRRLGSDLQGHPGTGLTRAHGGQFGRHVRARGDDQRLGRHQERRRRPLHGRQSGREPPLRLQVGDRGQEGSRGQARRGRPAVHADGGRRRPLRSRSGPAPTSRSSWVSAATPSRTSGTTRTTSSSTRTPRSSSARSSGSTTASSPASTPRSASTTSPRGRTSQTRRRRPTRWTRRSRTRVPSSSC